MPTYPWPLYHWPARLVSACAVCWLSGVPAFQAIAPGPLENLKEYGSKPASRAKTKEKFTPIGSVPLIPMVELLNPLGARLQIADLFCFWSRYEAPTEERGSNGAPWVWEPPPMSTMPKTVMACQVSSQFVETKSQKLMHVLGLEALAGGGAVVGTPSAAHASTWQKPAAARIVAAKMPSFVMQASLPQHGGL